MILFESAVALALICAMLLLHVIASFLRGAWQTVLNILNILLHIALLPVLLYNAVPLDESVLAYMASVLVYTLVRFISYEVRRGRDDV
ncbi:MAG: hypothetical protein IJW03_04535 [Clostridia bacterium]|nr:hypothetical protein [Clostridia bacterium]